MRTFKNTWFARFAQKEGISDDELKGIVNQLEAGRSDADLGGGVYKVRHARPGEGKSGGYRIIVYFKNEFRSFFVYGFEKSARADIDEGELR
ncbi:MAG: type II toxin-antitoxin system RelE/ParE family toxin, partial [Treponema sp.]|nr:type II toxin-antitoxin system RelE/ParE family toxin [Treponema sp.]